MDLSDAYDEACRLLGHQLVINAVITAERDEAGRRVAELTAEPPPAR
jgi:YD repeat-containing protein